MPSHKNPYNLVRIKEEDRDYGAIASSSRHVPRDIPSHRTLEPGEIPTEPRALRLPSGHPQLLLQAEFARNEAASRAESWNDPRSRPASIWTEFDGRTRNPQTRRRQDDVHSSPSSSRASRSTDEENVMFVAEHTRFRSLSRTRGRSATRSTSSSHRSESCAADTQSSASSYADSPPPESDTKTPSKGPHRCRCPINLQCPVRDNDWIDCRILVPELRQWQAAQREPDPWV
jgi:hypothetical protein